MALLHAARDEETSRAVELLQTHPELAPLSIRTASAAGNLAAVRYHLRTDPNRATQVIAPDFAPPLMYAVESSVKRALGVSVEDHVLIVRELLDAGASPNSTVPLPDRSSSIPVLYFPCVAGNLEVARLLLEYGAHPTDGESLYHAAQHNQRQILALLAEFGADLNHAPDGQGATPLYFLASHRAGSQLDASVIGGMTWLLEHGADPNIPIAGVNTGQRISQRGERPLHRLAAMGYDATVLQHFVAHGAMVDAARDDGCTPYQLARRAGNQDAAALLLMAGADGSRATPMDQLLEACFQGDADRTHTLTTEHPALVPSLDDEAADALLTAIANGNDRTVALMLSLGWPLDRESVWGGTPLHWAAWLGRLQAVIDLVAHGAPMNRRDSRYGSSPIAWAAHGSRMNEQGDPSAYPRIVETLLDVGATRPESLNRWGEAPEQFASEAVVRVLEARGSTMHSNHGDDAGGPWRQRTGGVGA